MFAKVHVSLFLPPHIYLSFLVLINFNKKFCRVSFFAPKFNYFVLSFLKDASVNTPVFFVEETYFFFSKYREQFHNLRTLMFSNLEITVENSDVKQASQNVSSCKSLKRKRKVLRVFAAERSWVVRIR